MVKSAILGYCRPNLKPTRNSVVQMDSDNRPDPKQPELTFSLVGNVDQSDFATWMQNHATKLGVWFTIVQQSENKLTLRAIGAPEMTQAFALACSLGPKSVCIDHLRILDGTENA